MAFQIIKENTNNIWRHSFTDSTLPDVIISTGFFRFTGDVYQLFSESGGSLRTSKLSDIQVIDNTNVGTPETFSTVLDITTRLKALDYPYFNEFTLSNLISSDSPNSLVLGTDGKLLVTSTGSGRRWDFSTTRFNTGFATIGNYNGLRQQVTTNTFRNDKGTSDISNITNISGDASYFSSYDVDTFISEIQITMSGTGRFGVLMDTGSIIVLYDEVFSFSKVEVFSFTGSNIIIPPFKIFKPYLLMDTGGVFGSFAITIQEKP